MRLERGEDRPGPCGPELGGQVSLAALVGKPQGHGELVAGVTQARRCPPGALRDVGTLDADPHHLGLDGAAACPVKGRLPGRVLGKGSRPGRLEVNWVDEHHAGQPVEDTLRDDLPDGSVGLVGRPVVDPRPRGLGGTL